MQAAVSAAVAGDTILVTEDLTVAAAVTLNTAVTVTGAEGVKITRTGTSATTFAISPAGDGATVSDLELTSETVTAGAFITINGADDVTLSGNTVYGPPQEAPWGRGG